ncbi:hypothetical protein OUZ56_009881 [Daphnia magna]|uniref:Uncharacterized protein n=1 Tax=Daphnia magna TaxID=35525 RepID=A0ABR0AHB9_9CRUS|nr:hypothetical protein OUZ56_009881 [Daphnia magna]
MLIERCATCQKRFPSHCQEPMTSDPLSTYRQISGFVSARVTTCAGVCGHAIRLAGGPSVAARSNCTQSGAAEGYEAAARSVSVVTGKR